MTIDIYSPYYIQRYYGGYSPCVEGNPDHGLLPFPGSVLPNCVGWAVGRFNEIMGLNACVYLGSTDAMYFMQYVSSQGLQYGMTPQAGSCMVWDDAHGEGGHVAIVEEVYSTNSVYTSESGWNYVNPPVVRNEIRNIGNGNWGYGGTFLGFIYLPLPPTPEFGGRKMPIWMMLRYGL